MKNKKPLNEKIQVIKTLTQSQKHLPTCLSRKEIAKAAQVGHAFIGIMQNEGLIERINDCDHWVEMDKQKENLLIVRSTSEYDKYNKTLSQVYKKKPKPKKERVNVDSKAESQTSLSNEELLLKILNTETKTINLFTDIISAFNKYLKD